MSWFGRSRDSGPPERPTDDPDPALPVLSRADAATVRRLAVERFAENGVETTIDGDALLAADGVFGLSNLAADAAATARRDWPDLVRRHVDALTADEERPAGLDEVRNHLFLRLRRAADLGAQLPGYAREVLPGIVEMVALDHPTRVVELLRPDDIDRLGGLMRRLGVSVTPHGVLVIVPNRHLLAVHPVSGDGALSPHLYYRPAPDAPFQQATTFDEHGRPGVRLEGPLEDAFRALGLVEEG